MNLYRVLPGPPEVVAFDTASQRKEFQSELVPPRLPWIRAIMVANSRGETIGPTGTSALLTRGADRFLLGLYRELADVVLVGASTVLKENVPTPRTSILAIITASGNLDGHRLVLRENARVVVITTPAGASRVAQSLPTIPHTVLVIDTPGHFSHEQITKALEPLQSPAHLLVEGGQKLWESFLPVTDEVALAVTPPPLDHHGGIPEWWGDTTAWTLYTMMRDDERMLYYRYLTNIRGESSEHATPLAPSVKK